MIKIEKIADFENYEDSKIMRFIHKRVDNLVAEYQVELSEIGQFVVTNSDDFMYLTGKLLEFIEVIIIGDEAFLHGVHMINDNYGVDFYVPVSGGLKEITDVR